MMKRNISGLVASAVISGAVAIGGIVGYQVGYQTGLPSHLYFADGHSYELDLDKGWVPYDASESWYDLFEIARSNGDLDKDGCYPDIILITGTYGNHKRVPLFHPCSGEIFEPEPGRSAKISLEEIKRALNDESE